MENLPKEPKFIVTSLALGLNYSKFPLLLTFPFCEYFLLHLHTVGNLYYTQCLANLGVTYIKKQGCL